MADSRSRWHRSAWTVETPHGPLSFVALGKGPAGRAGSLFTKQPQTIAWIDSFRPGSVFWDVGANVGVYTLYAARRGDTRVVAFEPAAVNYFVLSANCEINAFDDRVTCLLMGLGAGQEHCAARSVAVRRGPVLQLQEQAWVVRRRDARPR